MDRPTGATRLSDPASGTEPVGRVTPRHFRRGRRSRGQSLVEFAVILPVFLLILSGVLDFGFLLYGRINAINAIKESAQCGTTGLCTVDASGQPVTWSTMVTGAGQRATNFGLPVTPQFACIKPIASSPTCPSAAGLGGTSMASLTGDAVQATATYQYQTFFPLLFGTKINVSVSTEMVIYPPPPPN